MAHNALDNSIEKLLCPYITTKLKTVGPIRPNIIPQFNYQSISILHQHLICNITEKKIASEPKTTIFRKPLDLPFRQ